MVVISYLDIKRSGNQNRTHLNTLLGFVRCRSEAMIKMFERRQLLLQANAARIGYVALYACALESCRFVLPGDKFWFRLRAKVFTPPRRSKDEQRARGVGKKGERFPLTCVS